jgi:uncharacterized protein YndB with AHSA1/START domain
MTMTSNNSNSRLSMGDSQEGVTGRPDLVITRIFNAPRDLVWQTWTDPKHLGQWWGPKDFTNPLVDVDVQRGGGFRIDMQGPDGTIIEGGGMFHEIVAPERLVFTTSAFKDAAGSPQIEVLNTITFEEFNGKTRMILRASVVKATPEMAGPLSGMEEGWNESLDKLADLLAKLGGDDGGAPLVVTRVFDAPVDMVWKAWTEPDRLMKWWGPAGHTSPVCKIDLQVGGKYLFCMRSPDGQDFYTTGIYQKIFPLKEIIFTDSFADAEGNIVPSTHYGMQGFPTELTVSVTFEDEGNRTKVTMRQYGLPAGEIFEGTGSGWAESFEKLAESLR